MFMPLHPTGSVGDHCVIDTYTSVNAGVVGIDAYVMRGLPMHIGDISSLIRLPDSLRSDYDTWTEYAAVELDLMLPAVYWSDQRGAHLNGPNRGRYPLVFKLMPWAIRERPELAPLKSVADRLDHKGEFIRLARQHRIRTPETVFVDGLRASVEHAVWPGYPCWVKPSVGASGLEASFCSTESEFMQATRLLDDYQIQQHIEGTVASAQLWVGEDGPVVLMTTDQIMVGEYRNVHAGNIFPAAHDGLIRPIADHLGRIVHSIGFRGYCGFDVLVAADGAVYALEMNARLTGAHYPGAMAGHLGLQEWMNVSLEVREVFRDGGRFLNALREEGLLWTRRVPRGVIPWFTAALQNGKVAILIPGDRREQQRCLAAVKRICS